MASRAGSAGGGNDMSRLLALARDIAKDADTSRAAMFRRRGAGMPEDAASAGSTIDYGEASAEAAVASP